MESTELNLMTDQQIIIRIKTLAAEERHITAEIIRLLEEVDRRKIFALKGYSSLFEFATKELGYSDSSAQRRISSMRIIKQIPELENKIIAGSLNLTNVSQAQRFFKEEEKNETPLSLEAKKEILGKLEGKSTREAERELLALSSNPARLLPDQIKSMTATHSQVRFMADQGLLDKWNEVRGLLAHQNSNLTLAELISEVTEIALTALKKKKFHLNEEENSKNFGAEVSRNSKTRYISASVKRLVYQRDQGKCTYIDSITGRRCHSSFALEFEHLHPYALGGENTAANLTVKCRQHNALSAHQIFGPYLEDKPLNDGNRSAK